MHLLDLVVMLIRESVSRQRLLRTAEPEVLMDSLEQVEAFDAQGLTALVPVYHFNAIATSLLTPEGGTVVDLGSGSGRYLAYLARRRPDLRIIGIELAPKMVEFGHRLLVAEGVAERVSLRVGDMTNFSESLEGDVDLVSSLFSLHHLPDEEKLVACLSQTAKVRERTGCGVWIFDHARPRHPDTPRIFPKIFTPTAPVVFNQDSSNSLIASFSYRELMSAMGKAGLVASETECHYLSRWMHLYQAHLIPGSHGAGSHSLFEKGKIIDSAWRDFSGLCRLFSELVKHFGVGPWDAKG